jgi:hypothetical protein
LRESITSKWACALAICLTAFAGSLGAVASDAPASEYAVKAAIVHKIAKFVTWPENGNRPGGQPLSICLPERDPIGPAIEALSGEVVQGRLIEVRRLNEVAMPTADCKILYLSRPSSEQYRSLIHDVADSPVLTIGDSKHFARSGGIVLLQIKEDQIQFAINVVASRRAGLGISAQLLQLARISDQPQQQERQ